MAQSRWTDRLDGIVRRLGEDERYKEIELRRLFTVVQPPSEFDLAAAIAERVEKGDLKAVYRVISRSTGGGIGEFSDILEVPEEIYDPTADVRFHVEPRRDIKIVYQHPRV